MTSLIMGVINVTPDSFSDGGQWFDEKSAINRGLTLLSEGADILDIGGESTRPGAIRIDQDEEIKRIIPVVRTLAAQGARVSVDTMRARVAEAAVNAGATIINDVSGGLADEEMFMVAASLGVDYVLMHWRGHSIDMQTRADYTYVVPEVIAELAEQISRATESGIDVGKIIIDPGLGFAKTSDHNWSILKNLNAFTDLGHRVLIGASRKRFLGELLAANDELREVTGREDATTAVSALAAFHDVWAIRVHEVKSSHDAVKVAERWRRD